MALNTPMPSLDVLRPENLVALYNWVMPGLEIICKLGSAATVDLTDEYPEGVAPTLLE